MSNPFEDGYHAGTVNDRECPHAMFSLAWLLWHAGNDVGVRVHCAVVEFVYLNSTEEN